MSINNVGSILATEYQYVNYNKKTETGFSHAVEKAAENRQAAKSGTSKWAGDMVVPQPPNYSGFIYDSTISNKSKDEMTLDEYKAYFQDKMDSLYTHPSQRNRNWVIDITDAAYERMKKDPEYEQKVLNCFAVNKSFNFGQYIPSFSYTHIDDTWEKCTAYTYGMEDNYQTSSQSSDGGLGDWWQERHERFEKLLEEQVKAAQKKALADFYCKSSGSIIKYN